MRGLANIPWRTRPRLRLLWHKNAALSLVVMIRFVLVTLIPKLGQELARIADWSSLIIL